jgi:hypothetical protein
MQKSGSSVLVLSPVEGVVLETAGPESEWYLKVQPTDTGTTHLLCGAEVQPWVEGELAKLEVLMKSARSPEARWDMVLAGIFLNR